MAFVGSLNVQRVHSTKNYCSARRRSGRVVPICATRGSDGFSGGAPDDAVEEYKNSGRGASRMYTNIPLGRDGSPLLRILIIGNDKQDRYLAETIKQSDLVSGVYYCGDSESTCDIEMSRHAHHVEVKATDVETWMRFCEWALVNVVFVGVNRDIPDAEEVEKKLAEMKVTFFTSDISSAVIDKSITLDSCLRPPVSYLEELLPKLISYNEKIMAEAEQKKQAADSSA